jgi:hypothetical protein
LGYISCVDTPCICENETVAYRFSSYLLAKKICKPPTSIEKIDMRIPVLHLYERPNGYLARITNQAGQVILEEGNVLMSFEEAIAYLFSKVMPKE